MKPGRSGGGRAIRILAPAGLFLLAFGVRALPWRSVLDGAQTHPFGNDAFYHLRRIVYSVWNFPDILEFDLYIGFPDGAVPIWTPYLDWMIAGLMVALGIRDVAVVERVAVWIPPLLGASAVLALYFAARRHFGTATAVTAGLILSVLSAHFWYSQIGFIDHHAAVALTSTLILGAGMTLVSRNGAADSGRGGGWPAALGTGVVLGASLLVWPGSLLHVVLAETAFLGFLLSRRDRGDANGFALRWMAANAVALGVVLPASLSSHWPQWGRFSPVVLTDFQPWLFGVLLAFGGVCTGLWRTRVAGSGLARRAGTGLAVGVALLVLSALWIPELETGAEDAWRWIAKRESFQVRVAESQPLLFQGGRLVADVASSRLSYFVFVFPLALAIAARSVRREGAALGFLVWWSAGLFLVTLVQKRFFNSFSVSLALMMAWSVRWALAALPEHWRRDPARWNAARAAACAIVVACLYPTLATYGPYLANQWRLVGDGNLQLAPASAQRRATEQSARWLNLNSVKTSGWLDRLVPEYGVLAPWPIGHVIEYLGRRPTVTDNFGDDIGEENFEMARRYYLVDEEAASEILEGLGVRYVFAQSAWNFLGEEPDRYSMFHALYELDGIGFDPPEGDPTQGRVKPLERHRLIYESSHRTQVGGDKPASFKIFEFVGGAQIVGTAAPGALVTASVPLRTNRRRELVYSISTRADVRGRYVLRVPYANEGAVSVIEVGPVYELECEGQVKTAIISEAKVLRGGSVRGPRLCRRPSPRSDDAAKRESSRAGRALL